MSIFGDNQFKKNKVYYRRKSIRLGNWATALASGVCLATAIYFAVNRAATSKDQVDELSTNTLTMH